MVNPLYSSSLFHPPPSLYSAVRFLAQRITKSLNSPFSRALKLGYGWYFSYWLPFTLVVSSNHPPKQRSNIP
jgi:hypothetical protein